MMHVYLFSAFIREVTLDKMYYIPFVHHGMLIYLASNRICVRVNTMHLAEHSKCLAEHLDLLWQWV